MSINNGIVSAPIGLAEVAGLLGCGTDVGQCCTSKNINKWSRKKPMFIGWNKPNSPNNKDSIWKQYNFGLKPPEGGELIGFGLDDYISSHEDWNAQEWVFDPWPSGYDFLRLTDFDGYYHLVGAPFDVPGMIESDYKSSFNGNAANDEKLLVFDIDISVNPPTGGIGIFELGQNYGNFHLCLLMQSIKGDSLGEWFVHEDSHPLSYYESLAGLMASIQMQITVAQMKYQNQFMDVKWWLCGSSHPAATNSEWQGEGLKHRPSDLFDATTRFISLPTSRPEACRGTVKYAGAGTTPISLDISFWGVNNNNYWYPELGLRPVSTVLQFGNMLLDYTYGLQVGITIHNTTQDASYQLFFTQIKGIVSRTFDSNSSKTSIAPHIYVSSSTSTDVSLANVVTDYGVYNRGYVEIPSNGSVNLILDFGEDFMGVMGTTTTGQTINFDVQVVINNYWDGSKTFQGKN